VPVLHMTAVRGSILAFWVGVFLLGLLYLFLAKQKKIKFYVVVGLIALLLLVGFIWINRDSNWVQDIHWLRRITDISLQTRTIQTRIWSWQSGWEGFKEKPILGWGPENFVIAHAMHFKPGHFTGTGSETIWDRAHNVVLEMLTTMGIVGLISYLSIFGVLFVGLWKVFKNNANDAKRNANYANAQEKVGIAVLGVMFIVYLIHNLFIFDTTANYLLFFLMLGYLNHRSRLTRIKTQIDAEQISAEKGVTKPTLSRLWQIMLVPGPLLLAGQVM